MALEDFILLVPEDRGCNAVALQCWSPHTCVHTAANTTTLYNTTRLVHRVKYTLFDACVYLHFIIKGPTVVNIKISKYPIAIRLLDGSITGSTNACNLDTPQHHRVHPHTQLGHPMAVTGNDKSTPYLRFRTLVPHINKEIL